MELGQVNALVDGLRRLRVFCRYRLLENYVYRGARSPSVMQHHPLRNPNPP